MGGAGHDGSTPVRGRRAQGVPAHVENALEADALLDTTTGAASLRGSLLPDEPGARCSLELLRPVDEPVVGAEDHDQATDILVTVAGELWRPSGEDHGFRLSCRPRASAGRARSWTAGSAQAGRSSGRWPSWAPRWRPSSPAHRASRWCCTRISTAATSPAYAGDVAGDRPQAAGGRSGSLDLASRIRDTREQITPELVRVRLDLLYGAARARPGACGGRPIGARAPWGLPGRRGVPGDGAGCPRRRRCRTQGVVPERCGTERGRLTSAF